MRLLRAEVLLFLALWAALMVAGRSRMLQDPGTFWHTAVGEQILSEPGWPDTDRFTFTRAGQEWVPHQWLGEAAMAAAARLDGLSTQLMLAVTLLAGVYAWLGQRLTRAGVAGSVAAAAAVLTAGMSGSHFHVRPHLASVAGLAAATALLGAVESGRAPLRRLWLLVPGFWLWANLHGGVLAGFAGLGFAAAGWAGLYLAGRESPIRRAADLATPALVGLAAAALVLANPYGARLPEQWLAIVDSPVLKEVIKEHAPTGLDKPSGWLLALLGGGYVALLLTALPRVRATWLLPVVWMALAWDRVRNVPLFGVTALAVLPDLLPHTRVGRYLARSRPDVYDPSPEKAARGPGPVLAAAAAVLAVGLACQAAGWRMPLLGAGWARLDPEVWPVGLIPELQARQHGRPGGTRVFNEVGDGGFLIRHAPGFRVFADDRCELHGGEWLMALMRARDADPGAGVRRWERQYGAFDYALVRPESGFDAYFRASPDWERVARDAAAGLYRRRHPGLSNRGEVVSTD